MKLFREAYDHSDSLLQTVHTLSKGKDTEFVIKKGGVVKTEGLKLPDAKVTRNWLCGI